MFSENVFDKQLCKTSYVNCSLVGMNIACLVSLSTTTRMLIKPSDGGSHSIKSIDMDSHSCRGIGSCFSNP